MAQVISEIQEAFCLRSNLNFELYFATFSTLFYRLDTIKLDPISQSLLKYDRNVRKTPPFVWLSGSICKGLCLQIILSDKE